MRPQLHSPPMALRRLIACCLGIAAAALLMLGCGSGSDSTSADIDPAIASDFTNKLAVIKQYATDGDCDRATQALGTLKDAVDLEAGQTGEQFTSDLQVLLGKLKTQIDDGCEPPEDPTETTSSETTDSGPIATDTQPSTPTDTSPTNPTTEDTTPTTPTSSTPTSPTSPGSGNGNGQPNTPGGGINPKGKERNR
jgi:hypothetical protein